MDNEWVPSPLKYKVVEYPDGRIEWCYGNNPLFWRSASGSWYWYGISLPFNNWLARINISDEEKVMIKLRFG